MIRKGLGRGIEALIPDVEENVQGIVNELKITDIQPNKEQPRKKFNKEKLEELAESIKEFGVLQPIVVEDNKNGFYTIIAGERRWRAAKIAGISIMPAVIKEVSKQSSMEIALIENLQREDLNPIEEAAGFERLMKEFNLTQEEISGKVSKSRSAIANALRLLNLAKGVRDMLEEGKISAGHAKVLITLPDSIQIECAKIIIEKGFSVRQAEQLAKQIEERKKGKRNQVKKQDIETLALSENLSSALGMKVKIIEGKNKGKIEIEYYSKEDLHKLVNIIKSTNKV